MATKLRHGDWLIFIYRYAISVYVMCLRGFSVAFYHGCKKTLNGHLLRNERNTKMKVDLPAACCQNCQRQSLQKQRWLWALCPPAEMMNTCIIMWDLVNKPKSDKAKNNIWFLRNKPSGLTCSKACLCSGRRWLNSSLRTNWIAVGGRMKVIVMKLLSDRQCNILYFPIQLYETFMIQILIIEVSSKNKHRR